ncbi:MAG: nucleoside diphosphate kinase regulator [Brachymonas sp.]|jgi:regulator of nucleoside diphosphate kinase|nr:nucleoside diphosphate kinase regulator [Brachymonas sp.]MBP6138346.1 nucleoside diphosphate kinase regulator [Brachymonas sp.]MBP6966232.1 nucleoside diphosphate kinase regulator [Brachymonas sp.]MBP7247289.1 nucleoside diphosphate kinase regulator [Brachymonas sp.]MBP7740190.1 nucleoside diphosphate kinase regulator [Brachymonas sp.]
MTVKKPSITMSSLDWERLDRLVNLETYSRLPGVEALEEEMNRANVVEPTEVPPEVVTMNSTVEFIDDKTGQTFQMTLVYPDAVTGHETVSIFAPVGSALLGLSVGQSIVWQIPGGRELNLRVLKVLRQPEAMGEFHR